MRNKKNQKKKGRCQKIKLFLKPPNLLKFIIKKTKTKKNTRTALGMPKEEWNVFHIAGQCTD